MRPLWKNAYARKILGMPLPLGGRFDPPMRSWKVTGEFGKFKSSQPKAILTAPLRNYGWFALVLKKVSIQGILKEQSVTGFGEGKKGTVEYLAHRYSQGLV